MALVITDEKSIPSCKESISIVPVVEEDKLLLSFSHEVLKRRIALLFSLRFILCFFLNSSTKYFTKIVSKSSPPRCVSPAVALTSKIPSSIDKRETSKVPPPISKTKIVFSFDVSSFNPYAIAAAVGSLITLKISNPAIVPASLVACL